MLISADLDGLAAQVVKFSFVLKPCYLASDKPTDPLPDPKQGPPKTFAKNDVTFSWLKPANDGGDTNLEYEVKYCQQDKGAYPNALCKTVTTKKTSITISGLKEKMMYRFSVSAKNKQGSGKAWSFEARTGAKTGELTIWIICDNGK